MPSSIEYTVCYARRCSCGLEVEYLLRKHKAQDWKKKAYTYTHQKNPHQMVFVAYQQCVMPKYIKSLFCPHGNYNHSLATADFSYGGQDNTSQGVLVRKASWDNPF